MRRAALIAATALLFALVGPEAAFASSGDLDTTFGTQGFTMTDVGGDMGWASVAVQADGKLVVVAASEYRPKFLVLRYTADGLLDTTFSGDGLAVVSFGMGTGLFGNDVAITPDGKIVVVGVALATTARFAVARLTSDGSLDTTFSGDGRVATRIPGGAGAWASSVAVAPDGKVTVAGYVWGSSGSSSEVFALARYTSAGVLDTTFNGDGTVTTSFGKAFQHALDVALTPDGKIVVVGEAANGGSGPWVWPVARYTAAGRLDATFSGDGKTTVTWGGTPYNSAARVVVLTTGRIVITGIVNVGGRPRFGVARLRASGGLDGSFSGDGRVTTVFAASGAWADGLVVQADGRIVAVGTTGTRTGHVAVARYLTDGTLDPSFSGDGKTTLTSPDSSSEGVNDAVLQPSGSLVIVGGWMTDTTNLGLTRMLLS